MTSPDECRPRGSGKLRAAFVVLACSAVAAWLGSSGFARAQGDTGTPAIRLNDTLGPRRTYAPVESWVQVSYVVQSDGTVAHAIVEDSFGPPSATRDWVRDVLQWRFRPATWMSLPVEEATNQAGMWSDVDGGAGVGARMGPDIESVREMIAQEKWDPARAKLSSLQRRRGLSLYDFTYLSYLRGELESRQGRFEEAAFYLRRATGLDARYLGEQAFYVALYGRLRAEVAAGMHAEARMTIQELKMNRRYDPSTGVPALERRLIDIAGSRDGYSTAAMISQRDGRPEPFWDRQLLRSSFAFSDIEGELTRFELRCQRRHFVGTPAEGERVDLQPNWGDCRVYVFGEVGSEFRLNEHPVALE